MENTYCYSFDEECFHGEFDSREEAIKEAFEENKDYNNKYKVCWVGKCIEVIPSGFGIEPILEDVAHNTKADTCGDFADDYLMDVSNEHMTELEDAMHEVLFNWLDKHEEYKPTWFEVDDIEEVYLGGK